MITKESDGTAAKSDLKVKVTRSAVHSDDTLADARQLNADSPKVIEDGVSSYPYMDSDDAGYEAGGDFYELNDARDFNRYALPATGEDDTEVDETWILEDDETVDKPDANTQDVSSKFSLPQVDCKARCSKNAIQRSGELSKQSNGCEGDPAVEQYRYHDSGKSHRRTDIENTDSPANTETMQEQAIANAGDLAVPPGAEVPGGIDEPTLKHEDLPPNFSILKGSIVHCDERGQIIRVCQAFSVESMAENADGSGGTEIVLKFRSISGTLRTVRIPRRLLAGDGAEFRAILLDMGFDLSGTVQGRKLLNVLFTEISSRQWTVAHSRAGWTDDTFTTFILPSGTGIGSLGTFNAGNISGKGHGFEERGSLQDWQEHIASIAKPNPLCMFAICCSFAGPTLEPMGMESGGYHFGGPTSQGKTAMIRAGLSVWGNPKKLLLTWNSTSSGLGAKAALRNGTILAIDELKEASAKVVAEAVYMIMNGIGRSRANRQGHEKESDRWTLLCLSTGEMNLREHLSAGGEQFHAGQEVRLLSIMVDERAHGVFDAVPYGQSAFEFVTKLESSVQMYHGVAGRTFIHRLLGAGLSPDDLKRRLQACFETLKRTLHSEPSAPVGRVMRRFAAVMMAGELATELGITGWTAGAPTDAVISIFQGWRLTSEVTVLAEDEAAIVRVRDVILRGEYTRFRASDSLPLNNMAGWRGSDGFYILDSIWEKEMHPGLNARRMASHLKKAGLLICREPGRLQSKVPKELHSERPRAYLISPRILGDGHTEGDNTEV